MGRGKEKDPDTVQGAHASAYMRRDPDYRAAWAVPRGSAAGVLIRGQGRSRVRR